MLCHAKIFLYDFILLEGEKGILLGRRFKRSCLFVQVGVFVYMYSLMSLSVVSLCACVCNGRDRGEKDDDFMRNFVSLYTDRSLSVVVLVVGIKFPYATPF